MTSQCYEIQKIGNDIIIACDDRLCKLPESGSALCINTSGEAVPKMDIEAETNTIFLGSLSEIYQASIDPFTVLDSIRNQCSNSFLITTESVGGTINDIVARSTEIIFATSNGIYKYHPFGKKEQEIIDEGMSVLTQKPDTT